MKRRFCSGCAAIVLLAILPAPCRGAIDTSSLELEYLAGGDVGPGDTFPLTLSYAIADADAEAVIELELASGAVFVTANPAPESGTGIPTARLRWQPATGAAGKIIVWARAGESPGASDPAAAPCPDLAATATLTAARGEGVEKFESTTRGPACTAAEAAH